MVARTVVPNVDDPDALRQRLVAQYRQLPALEQLLIRLMSVIYEPANRNLIVTCWNITNAELNAGKHFSAPTLKPYLDRLLKANLLIQAAGQGPQCHPLLAEIATRDAINAQQFSALADAVAKTSPIPRRWKDGPYYFTSSRQLVREVRLAIYRHNLPLIQQLLNDHQKSGYPKPLMSLHDILLEICNNPFDPVWFRTLPPELSEPAFTAILDVSLVELTPADQVLSLLQEECAGQGGSPIQRVTLVEQLLLRGQLSAAQQVLEQFPQQQDSLGALWGWLAVLRGEYEAAIAHYTTALQALRKGTGKRKGYFYSLSGVFFVLALLKQGTGQALSQAEGYASTARQTDHWLSSTYAMLEMLLRLQQGDLTQKEVILASVPQEEDLSIEILIHSLCYYWVNRDRAKQKLPKILESFCKATTAAGYHWLAMEASLLLTKFKPKNAYLDRATTFREANGISPLVELIQSQEPWELCLNALTSLHQEPQKTAVKPETSQRLVWFVTFYPKTGNVAIEPREQKINAQGVWSKGRVIALKRLKTAGDLSYLTAQDLKVCACIEADYSYGYGYYGQTTYVFNDRAIAALVGHPLVFWADSPTTRVEIVKGEPELLVKKGTGSQLVLQFSPELKDKDDVLVTKETPTRLKVIEVTAEHQRIAGILGKSNRLEVPAAAKERVLAAINAVSGIVTVHSDIGGGMDNVEQVPALAIPHVHLLPAGDGLNVAVLTRPFAQGGPYYRPGAGGETVIAEIDGKRLQATRNLREEEKLAKAAIAACPTLAKYEEQDGEWQISDPEACLELLLELQSLSESIVLEWPQGEKLRVSHRADLNNFRLKIQRQNDWFATSGELKLDDTLVLDMHRLMELLDNTSSRFVPLGDGQFLALTQEFRKRLDELRAYSEKSGKALRIHPLAAVSLEDWIDQVGDLQADKYWKDHVKRLKEVQTFEPTLPSTLQADLRDYQLEGFRWLARLAHWGVGACLADDMGLGKTLQALAVILTRAPAGPTLVIAPTSVGMNWVSEAERFAPTLNVLQFSSSNRQKLVDGLQPFDLLVCSYGLLQQEDVAEMLAGVQWQTIVLDEAQSIKNFATKRSQAAMTLQGGFKLLTTGTPIENHLGELWNLFRFINPGLLGSLESFNQRFAVPIERYQDKQARTRLKTLIQPFLLRRTKNQVLSELPSRTEILLHVDLSQEELAFYEALRREAIAKLSGSDATAGAKHLQVLAEIMKLRRACCNTRLVKPDITLASSKLQLFGDVLTELLANRHKALVFSQFVDHLHIIRDYLDEQAISYQYLDGSTPAPERKKRVDAFQAGQGDVFLISLKAGGTGLNLTAADYVIHMDPWWNPAVEDQASDRAHRIGQQRPVTIYRLVARNTIEEKIVDLHQHKRDLADSLLEGADMSGRVSTDELLRLISET